MLVAIISDIHANLSALRTIAPVLAQADCVVCLGDVSGYYCQVNEVIDYLRTLPLIAVLGNHDSYVLNGCPATANDAVRFGVLWAEHVMTAANRAWLARLPLSWEGQLDGRSLFFVHGSPRQPLTEYLYEDNPALSLLADFSYDLMAFGHTHRVLWQPECRPRLLNPGSVGQARDHCSVACAAVLDTQTMAVRLLQLPYSSEPVMNYARQCGAGDWIAKHLTH